MPRRDDDEQLLALLQRIAQNSDETVKSVAALDRKVMNLDKRFELHVQKTEYELDRINKLDEVQNDLLDKHIEGVNTLKQIHLDYAKTTDQRLETLESPRRWLAQSVKVFIGFGAICSAVAGVMKLFHII